MRGTERHHPQCIGATGEQCPGPRRVPAPWHPTLEDLRLVSTPARWSSARRRPAAPRRCRRSNGPTARPRFHRPSMPSRPRGQASVDFRHVRGPRPQADSLPPCCDRPADHHRTFRVRRHTPSGATGPDGKARMMDATAAGRRVDSIHDLIETQRPQPRRHQLTPLACGRLAGCDAVESGCGLVRRVRTQPERGQAPLNASLWAVSHCSKVSRCGFRSRTASTSRASLNCGTSA